MRLIADSLIYRVILILMLGAFFIGLDVWMVFLNIGEKNHSLLRWISIIVVIIIGLVVVAYIISRQLIRPLKQLSVSARQFSTDINNEALVVSGPQEVREAAHSFNLMQERIQRFLEERMQLIAAISHDLRTPITRLRLRIEYITDYQQRKLALEDISQITEMIRSILDFIRDESTMEKKQQVDISSMLQTICDDSSDTLGPAKYNGPKQCVIPGKPICLRRALTNLIENAIRYGNVANIELVLQDSHLLIYISDSGPGIAESEIDNVFIPFYRIEKSRNRNTGGVGLGLSVARTLLQSQGGTIVLKNGEVSGLMVSVSLPLN